MKCLMIVVILFAILLLVNTSVAGEKEKILCVRVESENLLDAPEGQNLGVLVQGTRMTVLETKGNWLRVSVEGWVRRDSVTEDIVTINKAYTVHKDLAIELVDFEIKLLPVNYDASQYNPKVLLTLKVRNNTQNRIKAWKALVIVKNTFGDVLFRSRLTDGTANISPGLTAQAAFSWEDNKFIDNEPYDDLVAYSKENLRIELTEVQISP